MRILYINDELVSGDGSSCHAAGILVNLEKIAGRDRVRSYPGYAGGAEAGPGRRALIWRKRHKNLLQVVRFFRKRIRSFVRCSRICRELKKENWIPTHIIARAALFDVTAVSAARRFGAKLIYEMNAPMYYEHCVVNGLPLRRLVERWEGKILRCSDCIYTVSDVCRDMLCRHYGTEAEKYIVVPNGYMDELYDFSLEYREQTRLSVREREKYSGLFLVIFIGSLKPWHGISLLCETAALLSGDPKIHFLVAGDGEEYARVEEYCSTHKNMTYKGKLPPEEMVHWLWASDLGIMPYRPEENFYFSPLKMYDMIGAGLPFIGTDQGQIHEICTKLLGGDFLMKDCTAASIAGRIRELSEKREQLAGMKRKLWEAREAMGWYRRTLDLVEAVK